MCTYIFIPFSLYLYFESLINQCNILKPKRNDRPSAIDRHLYDVLLQNCCCCCFCRKISTCRRKYMHSIRPTDRGLSSTTLSGLGGVRGCRITSGHISEKRKRKSEGKCRQTFKGDDDALEWISLTDRLLPANVLPGGKVKGEALRLRDQHWSSCTSQHNIRRACAGNQFVVPGRISKPSARCLLGLVRIWGISQKRGRVADNSTYLMMIEMLFQLFYMNAGQYKLKRKWRS